MPNGSLITLDVESTAGGDAYVVYVTVNGDQAGSNRLSPEAASAQKELAREYLSLFENGHFLVERGGLDRVGRGLFETWLGDVWAEIEDELSGHSRCFVIASEEPDVLNLPWSLLRIPGEDDPIGLDPNTSIRLHPSTDGLADGDGDGRPGPLRVLYSACAPRDLGDLGYEKEEYQLLQTFSQTEPGKVAHFGCDLGAFDELQQRLREYRPHVVHLTGHGAVVDGEGHFAFEDERGKSDLQPGSTIVNDALANRGVQCVFVSGCQTAQAPEVRAVNGICQGLVNRGVPLAVGWAASILDDVATTFADTFYAEISAGTPIDRAVTQARRAAHDLCTGRGDEEVVDVSWTLPVLYAATTQAALYDDAKPAEEPPKPTVEQRPLPGMTEGHADYFIGRRREQQRLLPGLRTGSLNTAFLTGMGGVGKSTLATRLARSLEKDGFTPIAVPSTEDQPLTVGRLIDRCCEVFLDEGLNDFYQRLRNEDIDLRDRLRQLVRALNQNRFVLVLDNFEVNLRLNSREILDDALAWFLPHLVGNLTGSSRCIVTSRYLPAELDDGLPRVATELSLSDFPESAFIKFLLDDDTVEQRYLSGDLPRDLLSEVYALLGGTPRFLEQVRTSLADMPAEELRDALSDVDLPDESDDPTEEEKDRLREIRDEYVQDLFVRDLYHAIEPEASRTALSRAAVYTIPTTAEGFAAAAGLDESDVRDWIDEWQRRTFVTPVESQDGEPDRWTVPTLLRPWLLDQLSEEERTAAHRAAGVWLREGVEEKRDVNRIGGNYFVAYQEARSRFISAGEYGPASEITNRTAGHLQRRGFYDEAIRLGEEMLGFHRSAEVLNRLGQVYAARSEYGIAKERFEEAENELDHVESKERARALHGLATIALEQGEYEQAREEFEESLRIEQEIGNRFGEAATWHNLASIALSQGEYKRARKEFEEAMQIDQEIENRSGEASTRHQLASIAMDQGEFERARKEFEEALEIRQEIGDRSGEASTRHQLATIALRQGEYERAREEFEESLRIEQEIGNRSGEASTRHSLATIALKQGEYERAREEFEEALETRREIGDRSGEASTRHNLATIALEQGEYERAQEESEEALQICGEIGDRSGEAAAWAQLGILAADKLNRRREGLRLLIVSYWIFADIGAAQVEQVEPWVNGFASELGYDQETFGEEIEATLAAYQDEDDRGWSLLREAFADVDWDGDGSSSEDG
jgi:tetratricopeptide (TPR) repeat protein